jgi:hypothetical protein
LENAVAQVIAFTHGFVCFMPDKLDVLDGTATSRFFSRPAGSCVAGRAGRIMEQLDFIGFASKPMDMANG